MAASRWFRGIDWTALLPAERLCAVAAAIVAGSLLLPWYGIRFSGLSVTGVGSFGFAHAALLLAVAAALAVILRRVAGRPLPRPLDEGALIAVAGAWAALVVGYLMIDRPDELGGSTAINLRLGIFIALAGTLAILGSGIRLRRDFRRDV